MRVEIGLEVICATFWQRIYLYFICVLRLSEAEV
jgi:hypothetical protein